MSAILYFSLNLDKGAWPRKISKPEFYSISPIRRFRYKLPQLKIKIPCAVFPGNKKELTKKIKIMCNIPRRQKESCKKSPDKNALCNVPRGQKGLCKKSQDKNALYNVPRGQKGVCKNKSPDQITLYNNFVQLSEKSNCASDHFKRNSIFRVKFSN